MDGEALQSGPSGRRRRGMKGIPVRGGRRCATKNKKKQTENSQQNHVPTAPRAREAAKRLMIHQADSLDWSFTTCQVWRFFFFPFLSPSHRPASIPFAKPPQLECVRVDSSVPINHSNSLLTHTRTFSLAQSKTCRRLWHRTRSVECERPTQPQRHERS